MTSKKIRQAAFWTLLAALGLASLAFTKPAGGDSFEIYLDNQLLMQQYLFRDAATKTVNLPTPGNNKSLIVKYSHCGVAGKNRSISLKDAHSLLLKKYSYADAVDPKKGMVIPIKDIPSGVQVQLFYQSKELPDGKTLVYLDMKNDPATRVKVK